MPFSTSPSPAEARPDWRRRLAQTGDWRRRLHGRRRSGAAGAGKRKPVAHGRDRQRAAAPVRAHRRLGGDRAKAQPILSMAIMDGDVHDACACPISISKRKTARRSPIWRSSTTSFGALAALCDGSASSASRRPSRIGARQAHRGARALRRPLVPGASCCRRRRRALETARARRDPDHRLGLRPGRHRRDDRPRARSRGRAEQHFLPAGPFAILPLPGRRSSIVWNERRADADALLALAEELSASSNIASRRTRRNQPRLARRGLSVPLPVARRFVAERLALVGDAAHVVHPVAGQGLNLGLRDVAALAETIVGEMRLGLDPGAPRAARGLRASRGASTSRRAASASMRSIALLQRSCAAAFRARSRASHRRSRARAQGHADRGSGRRGSGAPKLLRGLAL